VVADRRDRDAGPERRAVLAHAPALLLVAAVGDGQLEYLGKMVAGAIIIGVEHPKVAADRLVGRIALEALGARVPRPDLPRWAEHEDRVVAHAEDETPELDELVLARRLGGGVGHVPGHATQRGRRDESCGGGDP